MHVILLFAILLLLIVVLIVLLLNRNSAASPLKQTLRALQGDVAKLESGFKEDFRINREENNRIARDNRLELNHALLQITEQTQQALAQINDTLASKIDLLIHHTDASNQAYREALAGSLKDFSIEQRHNISDLKLAQQENAVATILQLEKIMGKVETLLKQLNEQSKAENAMSRDALVNAFKGFQDTFDKNVASFNDLQREKFALMDTKQTELVKHTEAKLESIRVTVEEKLEKTLSERLGQSFDTVGKQLIEVQKGLGEMQTIASDVGGLKKVLSNVKLRGGVGEVQLALLLEQILAPSQYEANVRTKKGSSDLVEFAIKLPGRSEDESAFVYLPIDAKFPKDAYEHLISAYENAITDDIDQASKNMEMTIRKMAKDISNKYLDPPHTTDFAILFLPFESIYAEVIRRSALVDQLRTEFKITVAGPTTLMAILNSLQMGFRTLALQKRSSEVWTVLANVKNEFEKFGGLLEKAQRNIQNGLGQLDELTGTRTRAINRQLRGVERVSAAEPDIVLPNITNIIDPE